MANGAFLRDDPVLVCEEWIQLLVQAVVLMGQSIMSTRRGRKKKKRTTANKSLSGLTFVTFRAAFMSGYPAHTQR